MAKPPPSLPIIFEPDAAELLGKLLPYYIHLEVYEKILESRASEHSARMVAMKSATDNAKQLVKDLTLEYNKARQARHHERDPRDFLGGGDDGVSRVSVSLKQFVIPLRLITYETWCDLLLYGSPGNAGGGADVGLGQCESGL